MCFRYLLRQKGTLLTSMKVHVCSLPNYLSKDDIIELFEEAGEVRQFKYSGAHGKNCVEFEMDSTDAYLALDMYDGVEFEETPIMIAVK